jgi:cytochrome c6
MVKRKAGRMILPLLGLCLAMFLISYAAGEKPAQDVGESLFKENCSPCHPDGGNILNPKKTLHEKDLAANKINTAGDIVKKMRNPGPVPTHPQEWAGMRMFDKNKISDEDAMKIADYILKTFQ